MWDDAVKLLKTGEKVAYGDLLESMFLNCLQLRGSLAYEAYNSGIENVLSNSYRRKKPLSVATILGVEQSSNIKYCDKTILNSLKYEDYPVEKMGPSLPPRLRKSPTAFFKWMRDLLAMINFKRSKQLNMTVSTVCPCTSTQHRANHSLFSMS
jgi:hypothetical protein